MTAVFSLTKWVRITRNFFLSPAYSGVRRNGIRKVDGEYQSQKAFIELVHEFITRLLLHFGAGLHQIAGAIPALSPVYKVAPVQVRVLLIKNGVNLSNTYSPIERTSTQKRWIYGRDETVII